MKKQIRIYALTTLTALAILLTAPVFAQSPDQLKTDALAYIQNIDLADLFTRKDEDTPYELNLPDNVRNTLSELEVYDVLYRKVGINLPEEVKAGNLYVEDDMYYINFKEKKIEREIIKSQKQFYDINLKRISLMDTVQVDGLNLGKLGLTDISDLKFLINTRILILSDNQKIENYTILQHFKILNNLSLENNNLKNISFLKYVTPNLSSLNLKKNQIHDISILTRFGNLAILMLSNNNISSLAAISHLKIEYLSLAGNPISLKELEHIKELCYTKILYRLYIDRTVFKEYGDYFALYPEYLQWVDYIYFVEDDGSVTEWSNLTY